MAANADDVEQPSSDRAKWDFIYTTSCLIDKAAAML